MARITDLAANSSLAAADLLVVVDVDDTTMAATGTDKKLTVAQLLSFPANAVSLPANPAGTVSLTAVMMALGSTCAITTNSSGRVLVTMTGQARTATAAVSCTTGGRYGTGTAPVNGAAGTGDRGGRGGPGGDRPSRPGRAALARRALLFPGPGAGSLVCHA